MKVLVSDSLSNEGLEILKENFNVDVCTGLSEDELVEKIRAYDALVIRSGTQVTQRVIEAADNLKIIGRAGVGVDNIDVDAATEERNHCDQCSRRQYDFGSRAHYCHDDVDVQEYPPGQCFPESQGMEAQQLHGC